MSDDLAKWLRDRVGMQVGEWLVLIHEAADHIDTPAAEALERVRAEERESCALVAQTEETEMQKVADFYRPPRIDCDTYLADLHEQGAIVAARIAAAIRARGET